MSARRHLPSLATYPIMFKAHPTARHGKHCQQHKSRQTTRGVPWGSLIHKAEGRRVNTFWKPCHWSTRKGSFFQEQDLPQHHCFIRNTARAPGKRDRAGSWHPASRQPSPSASGRRRKTEGGTGQTRPSKGWFGVISLLREQRSVYTAELPRGQVMCRSLHGHPCWQGGCPSISVPSSCSAPGSNPAWGISEWQHHEQKPCQEVPAPVGMLLLLLPNKKSLWEEESEIQHNLSGANPVPVWEAGGCAARQPSCRESQSQGPRDSDC